MPDTTVSLGKGQKKGKYAVTPDQILAAAARSAIRYGLGEEGARVVQAILKTEGGLTGDVGDLDGGGSYGPTQLYAQGQLANLAKDLGVSVKEAAAWVQAHPIEAVDWSVGGYLGGAIRRGLSAGLSGANLATFAQKVGQVSVSPERAGQVYQSLFGRGGGLLGASVAEAAELEPKPIRVYRSGSSEEVDPDSPGIETQQGGTVAQSRQTGPQPVIDPNLQRVVNTKGAWISVRPIDPIIDNPAKKEPGDLDYVEKIPNPNPTYRYTWADGSHLDILATGGATPNYTVVGGTALASAAKQDSRTPEQVEKDKLEVDKARIDLAEAQRKQAQATSPEAQQLAALDIQAKQIALQQAIDKSKRGETHISGNYAVTVGPDGKISSQQVIPDKPDVRIQGGRALTIGPDGKVTTQVFDPTQDALATQAAQQQVQQGALNIQKAQQSLLPGQLLLIQNHAATVRALQEQVADPTSPFYGRPDLADQEIQKSKQYMDAALQGTTPFDIQKQKDDNERLARQQGIDIVNQRVATSGSLANSLLAAAGSLVNGALPIPGRRINLDPLGYARQFMDDPNIGGGPGVSDLARSLLLGGRGNAGGMA